MYSVFGRIKLENFFGWSSEISEKPTRPEWVKLNSDLCTVKQILIFGSKRGRRNRHRQKTETDYFSKFIRK